MRQLVYALRFRGDAESVGVDGNVLATAATATGCVIRSRINADGLTGVVRTEPGDEAICASELVMINASTFVQAGTVAFGGDRLRFSTIGHGHFLSGPDAGQRHGAAMWRVEGGTGQFAGAWGTIAVSFELGGAG